MGKFVYLARDEGELIKKLLVEAGCEIVVGDGECHDEYLAKCDALVLGKLRATKELLDKAPNLKIVAKFGVGLDRIDIPECTKRGIYVANTPLTNYVSVAEHAIMLMLAVSKNLYPISIYLRNEYPDFWCKFRYEGAELCGKTLALIGLGNIGRYTAKLAHGFDMKIIGYDPYADKNKMPDYIELVDSMEEALKLGDVVSIHIPGTETTRDLIGEKELALMKPSAILINVSRGFIVNQDALIAALKNKVIAGAGLDVFTNEPIEQGNPLMFMENVVATPHCAANTADARLRSQIDCAANVIDALEGRVPRFAANKLD